MRRRIIIASAVAALMLFWSWRFFVRPNQVAKTTPTVVKDLKSDSPAPSELTRGDASTPTVLESRELTHPLALHGTVLSAGIPVPGAFVVVKQGDYSGGGFTNVTGEFDQFMPRAGPVTFSIDGVRIVSGSPLQLNDNVRDHHLVVEGTGSISGTVLFDGIPVENANVVLDQQISVRTDTEGRYAFRALSPGTKVFRARSDALHASSAAVEVKLPSSGALAERNISLELSSWIAGTVLDKDGDPVSDVLVTWSCLDCSDGGQATTASDGKFMINDLRGGGSYVARAETVHGAFYPPANKDFPTLHVGAKEQISGVVLRIDDTVHTIEGRVIDAQGRPVPAVTVIALTEGRAYESKPVAETRARNDGRFVLSGVTSGLYVVAVGEQGEKGNVGHVKAGTNDVVVKLAPTGSIKGTIAGFSEEGLVNVSILGGPFQPMYAKQITSTNGFVFDEIPEGDWWLLAVQGLSLAVGHVHVRTAERSEVILRPASAQLLGQVDSAGSSGLVTCDWYANLPGLGMWFMGTAYADASGKLSIECIAGFPLKIECHTDSHVGEAALPAMQTGESMQVHVALSGRNSSEKVSTDTK